MPRREVDKCWPLKVPLTAPHHRNRLPADRKLTKGREHTARHELRHLLILVVTVQVTMWPGDAAGCSSSVALWGGGQQEPAPATETQKRPWDTTEMSAASMAHSWGSSPVASLGPGWTQDGSSPLGTQCSGAEEAVPMEPHSRHCRHSNTGSDRSLRAGR